jgi:hypothetical protein
MKKQQRVNAVRAPRKIERYERVIERWLLVQDWVPT